MPFNRSTFQMDGGEDLAKVLKALPTAVKKDTLIRILKKAAEPVRQRMSDMAPRGTQTAMDWRHAKGIADSISITVANRIGSTEGGKWEKADENQAAVAVGPDKDHYYGIFLEYGTIKMRRARPFCRPAFDTTAVPICLRIIQDELWEALADLVSTKASQSQVSAGPGGGGGLL